MPGPAGIGKHGVDAGGDEAGPEVGKKEEEDEEREEAARAKGMREGEGGPESPGKEGACGRGIEAVREAAAGVLEEPGDEEEFGSEEFDPAEGEPALGAGALEGAGAGPGVDDSGLVVAASGAWGGHGVDCWRGGAGKAGAVPLVIRGGRRIG